MRGSSEGVFFFPAVSLAAYAQRCSPRRRQELPSSDDGKKKDCYGDEVNAESDKCHCCCVGSGIDVHVKWIACNVITRPVYYSKIDDVVEQNVHISDMLERAWGILMFRCCRYYWRWHLRRFTQFFWRRHVRDSVMGILCACPKSDSALLAHSYIGWVKALLAPYIICIQNVQPGRTCKKSSEVHTVSNQICVCGVSNRQRHAVHCRSCDAWYSLADDCRCIPRTLNTEE